MNRFILLVLMALGLQTAVNAQRGVLLGNVWDSAHNYQLPSASVVVYNADSVMQQFTLTDALGHFKLAKLPVDQKLYIIVSYTGYKTITRDFIIRSPDTTLNLDRVNLHRGDKDQLDEVVVKALVPVRMNGDTLEFNADAFTLEKGTVVEDLLRKLPGVTLWGDGVITVNGHKVKSVTVDGKPFFGGDAKIATQNLDKAAVEKIQVYREYNEEKPLDSTLNMNIKLKGDKKKGYFGKLAAGAGSRSTYEGDLSINQFSPTIQAGVAGNINNVNKIAGDISTLLRNSTFKGSGTNTEYLTKFSMPGENRTRALGFTMQYDFWPLADYRRNNLLKSDYFFTSDRNETNRQTLQLVTIRPDSLLARETNNTNFNVDDRSRFRADYVRKKDLSSFFTSAVFNYHRSRFRNSDTSAVSNSQQELVSTSNGAREGLSDGRSGVFIIGMDQRIDKPNQRYRGMRLAYTLDYQHNDANRNEQTTFTSFINATENRVFNRLYRNNSRLVGHTVDGSLSDIGKLLLGWTTGARSGLVADLSARSSYRQESADDQVQDFDFGNSHFKLNPFLTNKRDYTILETTPSLNFAKVLEKKSANRYNKQATFRVKFPYYIRQDNSKSNKWFQQFTRYYDFFLPAAEITYNNDRFGVWEQNITLQFENQPGYPNLNQIAPLTDSMDIYNLQFGNPNLKAMVTQELTAAYRFINSWKNRDFSFGVNVAAGRIIDNIVASTNYDSSGRAIIYFVNTPLSSTHLRLQGNVNTSIKIGSHQVQVQLLSTNHLARTPNYINGLSNLSKIFNSNNSLSLYYDWRTLLSFKLAQTVDYQRVNSQQTNLSSVTAVSQASVAVNLSSRFFMYSNLYYTYNKYASSPVVTFNIWNAALAYRMMPAKNAEIKLSALDILRQNRSIVNSISTTSLTTVTSNILQQYFMLTLSFYPRKFGKHAASNDDE